MKKIDIKVICAIIVIAVAIYTYIQFKATQNDITNTFINKLNIIQVF